MTYKDITIKQFELLKGVYDTEGLEDIDQQIKIMSIVFGIDETTILNWPLPTYKSKVKELSFLTQPPKTKKHYPKTIKIGDVEYDVCTDIKKITAGQYIDYQSYISNESPLSMLLSVFFIPKGKKYGDYDMDTVIADLEKLDIETALSISFFFRKQARNLLKALVLYLDWMMKKQKETKEIQQIRKKMRVIQDLLENGTGSTGVIK